MKKLTQFCAIYVLCLLPITHGCGSAHHSATRKVGRTTNVSSTTPVHSDIEKPDGSERSKLPNLEQKCTKAMTDVTEKTRNYSVYLNDEFLHSVGTCGSSRVIATDDSYYFYNTKGVLVGIAHYFDVTSRPCMGYSYYGAVPTDCELKLERVTNSLLY